MKIFNVKKPKNSQSTHNTKNIYSVRKPLLLWKGSVISRHHKRHKKTDLRHSRHTIKKVSMIFENNSKMAFERAFQEKIPVILGHWNKENKRVTRGPASRSTLLTHFKSLRTEGRSSQRGVVSLNQFHGLPHLTVKISLSYPVRNDRNTRHSEGHTTSKNKNVPWESMHHVRFMDCHATLHFARNDVLTSWEFQKYDYSNIYVCFYHMLAPSSDCEIHAHDAGAARENTRNHWGSDK